MDSAEGLSSTADGFGGLGLRKSEEVKYKKKNKGMSSFLCICERKEKSFLE
jgi:hypothetical protein